MMRNKKQRKKVVEIIQRVTGQPAQDEHQATKQELGVIRRDGSEG